MTWQDLREYIEKQSINSKEFLKQKVCVYDQDDGEQYLANVIELLEKDDSCSGWRPYLIINETQEV
jgi:hypothetical protein